jgi:hypothetical protein
VSLRKKTSPVYNLKAKGKAGKNPLHSTGALIEIDLVEAKILSLVLRRPAH